MSASHRQRIPKFLSNIVRSAWFSYSCIVLLQVKVMLWLWEYRDLTPGDASSYFFKAYTWVNEAKGDIVGSPLYTLSLALLHILLDDPFLVLAIAQIGIAVCASILVLALFRRLLPNHIAWMVAAWWALLPINFDTVYSVHLFSALFPLALFVVAAHADNIYGRGIVLGGLLMASLLVRNEYGALFILYLPAVALYEFYRRKTDGPFPSAKKYLYAYGLPLLMATLIAGGFLSRSVDISWEEMNESLKAKHTVNVCQIYAYNRLQQGDPWSGDPWTECQTLIERDFKRSDVSFSEALFLNPGAMWDHIVWNIGLIPSGTQLALFNFYSGGANPDYMPARRSPVVWLPFLVVLALAGLGAAKHFIVPLLKHRVPENAFAWLLMSGTSLLVFGLMLMQRPRPSYMFPYTVFIMALAGLGLHALFESVRLSRIVEKAWPLAGILLILFVPSWYDGEYTNHFGYKGQGWRDIYEQVAPYVNPSTSEAPSVMAVPAGDYSSLCNYLGVYCRTPENKGTAGKVEVSSTAVPTFRNEHSYLLYHEDMVWKFASASEKGDDTSVYVELNCFSIHNNRMRCMDGEVDLNRGFMTDGSYEIPLRAALFVNDGYVAGRKDYGPDGDYYLQVLMKDSKIDKVLVADERLYETLFNQQYLLGNFDRRYFEEIYNDYPLVRILKVKESDSTGFSLTD